MYKKESKYSEFYKDESDNYEAYSKTGNIFSGIIGASYLRQSSYMNFMVQFEYFYNGDGCTSSERSNYFNKLEKLYGDINAAESGSVSGMEGVAEGLKGGALKTINTYNYYYLNQHYVSLTLRLTKILTKFDFANLVVLSVADKSVIDQIKIEYNILDNMTLCAYSNCFIGGSETEYGEARGPCEIGGFAKILF